MVPESWCSCRKGRGMSLSLSPLQSTFWSFAETLLQLAILPRQAAAWLLQLPRNCCHFSSLTVRRQECGKASGTSICTSRSSYPLLQSRQQSEVAIGSNVGTSATWLILVVLCLCKAEFHPWAAHAACFKPWPRAVSSPWRSLLTEEPWRSVSGYYLQGQTLLSVNHTSCAAFAPTHDMMSLSLWVSEPYTVV